MGKGSGERAYVDIFWIRRFAVATPKFSGQGGFEPGLFERSVIQS